MSTGIISLVRAFLQGIPTIHRAVINIKEEDDIRGRKGDKELLVEGYGLQKVMITHGSVHSLHENPSVPNFPQELSESTLLLIMSSKLHRFSELRLRDERLSMRSSIP